MPKTLMIDIGHGNDTKGKGVAGFQEHEFNADVGVKARTLAHLNGINVIFSQQPNAKTVSLSDRVKIAKQENVDAIISIHADASANENASGHWSFYWEGDKKAYSLARLWSLNAQRHLLNRSRGVVGGKLDHWANFHMTREPSELGIPAILCEHGFMTNETDLKLLKGEAFRRDCAEVLVRTACDFFGMTFKPSAPPVENKIVTPTNVTLDGSTYDGVLYNGSSYMKVRDVATILGKVALWDAEAKKVDIK